MRTPIVVNRRLAIPLHRQIYDAWCTGILDGRFARGDRMPSSRELAAALRERGISVDKEPSGSLVTLGTAPEVVGQVAAEHGLALVELVAVSRSLEDVFFELTEDKE